ncbi:MAG: FAD binding domain-containing protein [Anaerolineales bacterium]|nr:FAD binding domain-containing protein [Anaerolineales bacterium]
MWERYYTPESMNKAVQIHAEFGPESRVIAGATDLMLELERKLRPDVKVLVDITRIPGLDQISEDNQGWIHLGPLVTHNHAANSRLLVEKAFALAYACWMVGSPQIRNRGTIAGNLITASPANDTISPLMALGAKVTLQSAGGIREVALKDFYLGVRKTVMEPGEILVDIAFPAAAEGVRSSFYKLALRRAQAISVVNAAVVLEMDGKKVKKAAITLGSVAPTIIHAGEAEVYLAGKELSEDVMEEVGRLSMEAARPIDDLRASAAYRKQMVRVSVMRILRSIAEGREKAAYPESPVMLWGAEEPHLQNILQAGLVHTAEEPIRATINGKACEFTSGQDKTLLRLLREEGGLTGPKEGCSEGECGACTVWMDGIAVMSCLVPAPRAHGTTIVTVEGLAKDGKLHPIQQAFIEEGAVQCGYCTPGFLMSGAKLLEERPQPDEDEIKQAITGNLCRCTGYYKIISAFEKAAKMQV